MVGKLKKLKVSSVKFIEFTQKQSEENIQIRIAKLTGNYKRGNEKQARKHPRNAK